MITSLSLVRLLLLLFVRILLGRLYPASVGQYPDAGAGDDAKREPQTENAERECKRQRAQMSVES